MKHTIATTLAALQAHGLPGPVEEFAFHPARKWRFDFAWIDYLLALEVEGLGPRGAAGRHQRARGMAADAEKYNAALLMGWRVLRCTTRQVASGQALAWLEQALGVKEDP